MEKKGGIIAMKGVYLEKVTLVLSFSLLLALLSQIRIPLPFTPVPVTLQTLGVLFIGYYLGPRLGVVSVLTYLMLGALGLPFFSGLKGGLLHLSGPTGGYLMGFVAGVYLVGLSKEKGLLSKHYFSFLVALCAHLVIYFFGTLWFISGFYHLGLAKTLKELLYLTVFPFLIVDIFKALLFTGFILVENKVRGAIKR